MGLTIEELQADLADLQQGQKVLQQKEAQALSLLQQTQDALQRQNGAILNVQRLIARLQEKEAQAEKSARAAEQGIGPQTEQTDMSTEAATPAPEREGSG